MHFHEPLEELFKKSKLMILDFAQIPLDLPKAQNIQAFFAECEALGLNPRLPENRQKFNNLMLQETGMRYLVSRYGEDRQAMLVGSQIAAQGRTLHMGVDIFSKDLETVYAPCNGKIVRIGYETQEHGYGNYLIIQPDNLPGVYFFFGHLSKNLPKVGSVEAGEPLTTIGDYLKNENGGWSRHLHLQVITELPSGENTPNGYSTKLDFTESSRKFPDPMSYFPDWHIK